MPRKIVGSVALIAALTILPTLSIAPASAQNWFQRTFNRVLTPTPNYPYNYNNLNYGYPAVNPYYTAPVTTGTPTNYDPVVHGPQRSPNYNQMVSAGVMSQAEHAAWVRSIEARVARGELTPSQGNLILTRGYE